MARSPILLRGGSRNGERPHPPECEEGAAGSRSQEHLWRVGSYIAPAFEPSHTAHCFQPRYASA